MELRYHRAVIVLWPKNKWIDIICQGDKSDAVRHMIGLISKCNQQGPRDTPEWQTVKRMATLLMTRVRTDVNYFNALFHIGEIQWVQKYLQHLAGKEVYLYGQDNVQQFCLVLNKCFAKFGWDALAATVTQFAKGKNNNLLL